MASGVDAQIGVPSLPVSVPLPGQIIDRATQSLTGAQDSLVRSIIDARAAAARALIRQNRTLIEADPDGAPIVRAELLAYGPDAAALHSALAAGFVIVRREALEGLGGEFVTLRGPPGVSTKRALAQLRRIDPAGDYDYNHIYWTSGSGDDAAPIAAGPVVPAPPSAIARIGMIDSGVDLTHPALALSHTEQRGCDGRSVPAAHGTAVASLIAGSAANFRGAMPGARLLAVDVYCADVTGGSTDRVALAFATLTQAGVAVINVSLVGPRNATLARVVAAVQARGVLVVAAVGNDGPAAAPLYPAALPGVIAVTGVDDRDRVLPEAGRGSHVAFAAPGAELRAADLQHGYATVRGTSYAAPIVAGLLGGLLGPQPDSGAQALQALIVTARDLGPHGRDPIYGYGLVGEAVRATSVQ
jgi:subtilisin family serine protease